MNELIKDLVTDYERKLEEFKVENSIMWKTLLDIGYRANSLSEAQEMVRKTFAKLDEQDPFKPLVEVEKQPEIKEDAA